MEYEDEPRSKGSCFQAVENTAAAKQRIGKPRLGSGLLSSAGDQFQIARCLGIPPKAPA